MTQLIINPFSYKQAGDSLKNPYLYGLPVRLNFRADSVPQEVFFYSSDVYGRLDNKYNLTYQGDGLWYYFALAGAGAFGSDVWENAQDWDDGVTFYLSFWIRESIGYTKIAEKKLVIAALPDWPVLFGNDKQIYIAPVSVFQGTLDVKLDFFPFWKNEAGVRQYGGVDTVQIFDTPGAPGSGYISPVAETAIASLPKMDLINRYSAAKITDYVQYPGWADYSNWFYYITFRFRAKSGDTYYRDFEAIIYLAGDCANVGYTSSTRAGQNSAGVGAPLLLTINSAVETPPPPTCSSNTKLNTNNPVNPYSDTTVEVYDAPTGGNLIASGTASVSGANQYQIDRTALGGDTSQPVQGYYGIAETNPSRTSTNRIETYTDGCVSIPVTISTITGGGNEITVTTTGGSRDLIPTGTYQINYYTNKYDATPVITYDATYVDAHTLTATETVDRDGFWEIVENGIVIDAPREYSDVVFVELVTLEYVENPGNDTTADVKITNASRVLNVGSTYKMILDGSEEFAATYTDPRLLEFTLALPTTKDGDWTLEEDSIIISDAAFNAKLVTCVACSATIKIDVAGSGVTLPFFGMVGGDCAWSYTLPWPGPGNGYEYALFRKVVPNNWWLTIDEYVGWVLTNTWEYEGPGGAAGPLSSVQHGDYDFDSGSPGPPDLVIECYDGCNI